jgi:hypothetical protein
VRFAAVGFALALLCSCCSCSAPTPAFPIPDGPARPIALDVQLPVYVLGRWTVDSFSQTLALQLARYNIAVVDRRSAQQLVALIDLGRWTYRTWQEIDVALACGGQSLPAGRVQIADFSMSTLDVAAQSVALIIAKAVWTGGTPSTKAYGCTRAV